jgi:hypothetical protein
MEYKKITMIPLSILKNCLFFDVETAGWCPDLECLREENPRLAKILSRIPKLY